MQKTKISYKSTGILHSLMQDYIDGEAASKAFVQYPFELSAFKEIIENKAANYTNRALLHSEMIRQYEGFEQKEAVIHNINLLKEENCFSITTAHQSNILTGPLYTIYKAISAINTCKLLKAEFPNYHFVPVFWQGSEDHDYEEVNHTFLFDKKLEWKVAHNGEAVGRMPSLDFEAILEEIQNLLGDRPFANELNTLFANAYNGKNSIAVAYKYILHYLLGEYGLLVLDQDSKALKSAYIPSFKAEIQRGIVEENVLPQIQNLEANNYKVQAQPRAINLFYIDNSNIRNRIVKEADSFKVLNTDIVWKTEAELFEELEKHAERFSPNVFLRPMYQEQILPNLAYVGGQGELAYWMELKPLFEANNTAYPMLILRSMAAMLNNSTAKRIDKLELSLEELFLDEEEIIKRFVKEQSDNSLELSNEKEAFEVLYAKVKEKAVSIDPSLGASVESVLQGQLKALANIETKILRAEKRNFETAQNQIRSVKSALFPNGTLQERSENFMQFYSIQGPEFISDLLEQINPFDKAFYILSAE